MMEYKGRHEVPKTKEELAQYIQADIDSAINLRNEINKEINDLKLYGFRERKALLQNFVIASVTLLGFIAAFSAIGGIERFSEILGNHYFVWGVGLHLFFICFVAIYLRESGDMDIAELIKLQDGYNEVLEEQKKFSEESLIYFKTNLGDVSVVFDEYLKKLFALPSVEKINNDKNKLDTDRKKRKDSKNIELEFSAEIGIFSFIIGTALIFIATLGINLPYKWLALGFIILFYFTFTDSLIKRLKPIFKLLTFITRKEFLCSKIFYK